VKKEREAVSQSGFQLVDVAMDENTNIDSGPAILVADDDPSFLEAFCQMLTLRGYQTTKADRQDEIISRIQSQRFDALTLDLDWEAEEENGLAVLQRVQQIAPLLPVVVITGHATIPTAVEATRMGAFDYIEKGLDREKVLLTLKNAISSGCLKRENQAFLDEIRTKFEIVGDSAPMQRLKSDIAKAGATDSRVLIVGESGTGKELVARQLHYAGNRREKPFVSVDSGTLSDSLAEAELFGHAKGAFTGAVTVRHGLIQEAEGGTLFLDEIANASTSLQAKLLHVIQAREYRRVGENDMRSCDVRIIAASNRDLPTLIEEQTFREDLYYRLKVVEILMPPLRERKEDIPLLLTHFLKLLAVKSGLPPRRLTPEAVNVLLDFDWPGNVRETENTVERIVVMSEQDEIDADDVKAVLGGMWLEKTGDLASLSEMTREFRRECIIKAINLAEGRIARAAEILKVDRTHLYKLINEYNLKQNQ